MTVGALLVEATDRLTAAGVPSPAHDARELLAHVLQRRPVLLGRTDPLLGGYEEPLTKLAPSVRRLADTLDPDEVEAMVRLIDQLPGLVTQLDEVVLPVLGNMGNVGEDVHDLLDTMQDLRQVVKGFPGSRLFRRRGAEEIQHEEQEEQESDDEAATGT